jgi:hypothetical protein
LDSRFWPWRKYGKDKTREEDWRAPAQLTMLSVQDASDQQHEPISSQMTDFNAAGSHSGKPRLVIHQMVLENFKSYQGRHIIGPFHKVQSAILTAHFINSLCSHSHQLWGLMDRGSRM